MWPFIFALKCKHCVYRFIESKLHHSIIILWQFFCPIIEIQGCPKRTEKISFWFAKTENIMTQAMQDLIGHLPWEKVEMVLKLENK